MIITKNMWIRLCILPEAKSLGLGKSSQLLEWWHEKLNDCLLLYNLGLRYLCISAIWASSECSFFSASLTVSALRSHLTREPWIFCTAINLDWTPCKCFDFLSQKRSSLDIWYQIWQLNENEIVKEADEALQNKNIH